MEGEVVSVSPPSYTTTSSDDTSASTPPVRPPVSGDGASKDFSDGAVATDEVTDSPEGKKVHHEDEMPSTGPGSERIMLPNREEFSDRSRDRATARDPRVEEYQEICKTKPYEWDIHENGKLKTAIKELSETMPGGPILYFTKKFADVSNTFMLDDFGLNPELISRHTYKAFEGLTKEEIKMAIRYNEDEELISAMKNKKSSWEPPISPGAIRLLSYISNIVEIFGSNWLNQLPPDIVKQVYEIALFSNEEAVDYRNKLCAAIEETLEREGINIHRGVSTMAGHGDFTSTGPSNPSVTADQSRADLHEIMVNDPSERRQLPQPGITYSREDISSDDE